MSLFEICLEGDDVFVLVSRGLPVHARGAALMATLAEPPVSGKGGPTRSMSNAISRMVNAGLFERDPELAQRPQPVIPAHLLMDRVVAERWLRKLRKGVEARLGAAHAAAAFLQEAEALRAGRPLREAHRPRVNAAAKRTVDLEAERLKVLAKHGVTAPQRFKLDPDNFEQRVVRASLPVIHLAFATAQAVERSTTDIAELPEAKRAAFGSDVAGADKRIAPQIDIGHVLADESIQDFIVRRAEELESLLPLMRRLRPTRVVRFRFV